MIRTTHIFIVVLVAIGLSSFSMWQRSFSVETEENKIARFLHEDSIDFASIDFGKRFANFALSPDNIFSSVDHIR